MPGQRFVTYGNHSLHLSPSGASYEGRAFFESKFGRLPGSFRFRVWLIILVYAMVSMLWIYFSDQVLAALASDPTTFTRFSVYKGVAFVVATLCCWC